MADFFHSSKIEQSLDLKVNFASWAKIMSGDNEHALDVKMAPKTVQISRFHLSSLTGEK